MALYPKWIHDPTGFNPSTIVPDEEAEKALLEKWGLLKKEEVKKDEPPKTIAAKTKP